MTDDLFEDLHNLEENYYQDGYRLGVEDGSRTGRIEGRTFGLEKGFEKFFEMGKLHGKAQILTVRLPPISATSTEHESMKHEGDTSTPEENGAIKKLPNNERLAKHIRTLFALSELESLSTENNEDAVSEFDDRFKRAVAKAKVIENIVGERNVGETSTQAESKRAGVKISRASTSVQEKNIEDFGMRTPTTS
jgi:hypothetical protein